MSANLQINRARRPNSNRPIQHSAAAGFALLLCLTAANSTTARSAESPATYHGVHVNEFMTHWLLLGPIPISEADSLAKRTAAKNAPSLGSLMRKLVGANPDDATQQQAFNTDFLKAVGGEAGVEPNAGGKLTIGKKNFVWKAVDSRSALVDLALALGKEEFVVGYAYAEIIVPAKQPALLALGSDDGVKAWLNGKLVHDNWIGRIAQADDDLVPVQLVAGRNRLLLKIQNGLRDWGFMGRWIGTEALADRLVRAAMAGDLGLFEKLGKQADLNLRSHSGLTALQAARIYGQAETAAYLTAHGANPKLSMPAPEKIVDGLLRRVTTDLSPGVAVLVAQHGKILYQKGFGYANLEHRVPVTPETKFRIGSITKQFTAAAVLKLQEQGKLKVTDHLSQYFPDFPKGDKVTIHHLLTHTSGIHSYTNKVDFMKSARVFTTADDLIRSFKNDPYDFEPGQRWLYNNSGFFLLGRIVEKVSGKSYGDFLRQTFFDPLGMKDTGVHRWSDILAHEAAGYSFENGKLQKADNWDMSRAGGAGSLYSTVGDLFRWNEAVFGGKVLSAPSLKAAWTAVLTDADPKDRPKETGYGYGWGIGNDRGLRQISHSGGLHGFNTDLVRFPDQQLTIVVLINALPPPPGLEAGNIANEIANLYLWQAMQQRPVLAKKTIDPKILDTYVGRYDYGGPILTVTRQGNRLFAQLTGQPTFEIFPKSETEYFWKVVDAQVTFVKNEQGEVTRAIHRQGGQTIDAPRLADLTIAKIDPALLTLYAGHYILLGQDMTITREGDRLFAQIAGQPKTEIVPKSDTEFQFTIVNARLTFVKDKGGNVTKAILDQAGQKFDAPRKK